MNFERTVQYHVLVFSFVEADVMRCGHVEQVELSSGLVFHQGRLQ